MKQAAALIQPVQQSRVQYCCSQHTDEIKSLQRSNAKYRQYTLRVPCTYLDMAQQVMQPVLRLRLAPVASQTPVCNGYLLNRPFVNRQTTEKHKAPAIHCFVSELYQLWSQLWQLKIRLLDILQDHNAVNACLCCLSKARAAVSALKNKPKVPVLRYS